MHSVTDRRTDGQQAAANSRSYCVAVRSAKKGQNSTQKNRSLLVYIVDLSMAVVKVDIKVINACLTQNQCLQCVPAPLTHVEILRLRNVTKLNDDGMTKFVDVHYQTEPNSSIFPKEI